MDRWGSNDGSRCPCALIPKVLRIRSSGFRPTALALPPASSRQTASASLWTAALDSIGSKNSNASLFPQGISFSLVKDGVSEAMNSRSVRFGEERLRQVMERNRSLPIQDLREQLVHEILSFAGGAVQNNDMTMVLAKVL